MEKITKNQMTRKKNFGDIFVNEYTWDLENLFFVPWIMRNYT